ncbi:MAG: hypothetical protein AB7G93_19850 [Bdellovibrionales bacterium]
MRMIQRHGLQALVFTGAFALGFGVFQNCSPRLLQGVNFQSGLPDNHPRIDMGVFSKNYDVTRVPLMDMAQLEEKLVYAFVGEDASTGATARQLVQTEFAPIQQALGGSCDIARTGSFADCNYNVSHVGNNLNAFPSTIREAARTQACMSLTSSAAVMGVLVGLVKGQSPTPEEHSVGKLVARFYPDMDSTELVTELMEIDRTLARASESVTNRWSLLAQLVCESPGWQVF